MALRLLLFFAENCHLCHLCSAMRSSWQNTRRQNCQRAFPRNPANLSQSTTRHAGLICSLSGAELDTTRTPMRYTHSLRCDAARTIELMFPAILPQAMQSFAASIEQQISLPNPPLQPLLYGNRRSLAIYSHPWMYCCLSVVLC